MRFVDLFCGIGGFHAALSQLGHECVFACDIDSDAAVMYEKNFGIPAHFDIRECKNLPEFEILCAGFPCQPFSKSGSQQGFNDLTRGTLFHEIMRIVKESKPIILFLENVPNLKTHDSGNTFEIIKASIEQEGYAFSSDLLSPHEFGTPQIRKRLYMVAIKQEYCQEEIFEFPEGTHHKTSVKTILDKKHSVDKKYYLSEDEIKILDHWNNFIQKINPDEKPPSPTWSQEFNRSYPLENIHPISKQWRITVRDLKRYLEEDGIPIPTPGLRKNVLKCFPPYIFSAKKPLPEWKKRFIFNNRVFWRNNKHLIDEEWLPVVRKFEQTYQKFEWQVGDEKRDIWKHLIQFRPSGIRVKKTNYIPALVAIAQIPIIGWQKRRMTPKECARAQDFDVDGIISERYAISESDTTAYKQLGNAVNVKLTRVIFQEIENYIGEKNE
jgi:DNA (cytosine-5)-methyltransferase 1